MVVLVKNGDFTVSSRRPSLLSHASFLLGVIARPWWNASVCKDRGCLVDTVTVEGAQLSFALLMSLCVLQCGQEGVSDPEWAHRDLRHDQDPGEARACTGKDCVDASVCVVAG